MKKISVSDARQNLPSLIAEIVSSGNTVIITRRGRAMAKLVPVEQEQEDQALPLRGLPIRVSADFDEPLDTSWEAEQP